MSEVDKIRDLIRKHEQRLQGLKLRQAREGIHTDPAIKIEIEEIENTVKQLRGELSKFEPDGKKLVDLLNGGLHEGLLLLEDVRSTYQIAENKMQNEPDVAENLCTVILKTLDKTSSADLEESILLKFSRGKIAFLLAAIYLNTSGESLILAVNHFRNSRNEFNQWPQLRAIAFLGSAIAHRKRSKLTDARRDFKFAQNALQTPSITSNVTKTALLALEQAIKEEDEVINASGSIEPVTIMPTSDPFSKRVFNLATGARIITESTITKLNLLGNRDYLNYEIQTSEDREIEDLASLSGIFVRDVDEVSYILEVPKGVTTSEDIKEGDRILISEETNIKELNYKRVIVLIIDNTKKDVVDNPKSRLNIYVTLNTFLTVGNNRYFLEAENDDETSYLITQYQASPRAISHFKAYKSTENVENKVFYQVRITGEVKGIIRQGTLINLKSESSPPPLLREKPTIWKIPIVDTISAGVGVIRRKNIKNHIFLPVEKGDDVDFGLLVQGDSMEDFDLHSDDIALIRQQETVKNGEIAAIIINTPDETLEVIKEYHFHDNEKYRHWFLKSGNEDADHIVVIPKYVESEVLEKRYEKRFKNITSYTDSEVVIAGKFIRKHEERANQFSSKPSNT